MKKEPVISVIIASHRPEMVKVLLAVHLRQQHSCTVPVETIIVTDYPNDDLQQTFGECIWIHLPDRSISRKRNSAIRIASGTMCAFIDDDCIPEESWLMQGYTYLCNHPEFVAVEGKTTIECRPHISSAQTREYRRLEKPGYRTNNLFFRTAILRKIGCFDERFTVQREDMDLAFTALSQGYHYGYYEKLHVTHRFREGERWDLLKNCWNRRFDPLLYKKHPKLYRQHIRSPLTPTVKAGVAALLLLLCALVSRRYRRMTGLLSLSYFIAGGLRRTGRGDDIALRLFFESCQYAAAPVVTFAALLSGSLRHRTFLLL